MNNFPVISDGIAVYAYRIVSGKYQFLQLRRTDDEELVPNSWQIVYGAAEVGETAAESARRELKEETGLDPFNMYLIEFIETFFFRPRNGIIMLPVFAAQIHEEAVVQLNEEHDDYRWIEEDQLQANFMWRSQREALKVVIETIKGEGTKLELLRC